MYLFSNHTAATAPPAAPASLLYKAPNISLRSSRPYCQTLELTIIVIPPLPLCLGLLYPVLHVVIVKSTLVCDSVLLYLF
jgi:hypothetical protein